MGTNPSFFKGSNLPVEEVSWNDCQQFITKLNQLTGRPFRLPTEAVREYASRGGSKSRGYKYAGSNDLGSVAWYDGNSGKTHPVGQKQANCVWVIFFFSSDNCINCATVGFAIGLLVNECSS